MAAMVVIGVRGLAVSAFHKNTSVKKPPVPKRQQRIRKAPLADVRRSMLRFSLEASFGSIRRQNFPTQHHGKGYLSS
jgi:hypothetical protein